MTKTKKKKTYKKKLEVGEPDFKTSGHFKGRSLRPSNKQGFNASRFRVQHKG